MKFSFIFFRFLLVSLPVLWLAYDVTRIVLPQMPLLGGLSFRQSNVEIWLQGIQAAILFGLWLFLLWIFIVLLHLNWRVHCHRHLPFGFWRYLALACAIFLGLPALWECVWLCYDFLTKQNIVIEKQNLISALCVPYISLLTIVLYVKNHSSNKKTD